MNAVFEWLKNRTALQKVFDTLIVLLISGSTLGAYNYQDVFRHPLTDHKILKSMQTSRLVHTQLEYARAKTNSDAVMFFRYHNGTTGINGFSFIKASASDIDTEGSYVFDLQSLQNLPITAALPQIEAHLINECTDRVVHAKLPMYPLLRRLHIKSFVTCPVRDYDDMLVGYVIIVYKRVDSNELPLALEVARFYANEIGTIQP